MRGTNVAGQQWANVVHCRSGDGAGPTDLAAITALDAKLVRLWTGTGYTSGSSWLINCSADTKTLDITYYVLNGTAVPIVIAHNASGSVAAGSNQAQEIAHVLTLRTNTRGRRYRGRIYLPAAATTLMSNTTGVLGGATVTSFLNQARGLLADLPSIGWKWGVASYGHGTLNGQPQTWTPFFTDIQDFTFDAIPDVQRRRKQ